HDLAEGGVEGMAQRALQHLDAADADDADPRPVFVCGESFGGTGALTLAHAAPERIAGLILFSTFGWYPSRIARRGAGALAMWSFIGGRGGAGRCQAGRRAPLAIETAV